MALGVGNHGGVWNQCCVGIQYCRESHESAKRVVYRFEGFTVLDVGMVYRKYRRVYRCGSRHGVGSQGIRDGAGVSEVLGIQRISEKLGISEILIVDWCWNPS